MSRNQRRNRRNKSGGNQNANQPRNHDTTEDRSAGAVRHRSSTETKSSLKTTELMAYAATVLAVVITALALDEDGRGGDDPFGAETAIRYITYLTIGYMISRGLAKSGSHENRIEHDAADDDAPRTRAAGDVDERDDELDTDTDTVRDVETESVDTSVVPSDQADEDDQDGEDDDRAPARKVDVTP